VGFASASQREVLDGKGKSEATEKDVFCDIGFIARNFHFTGSTGEDAEAAEGSKEH
jgi:hypothetical protein